jgi:hypothetical protein
MAAAPIMVMINTRLHGGVKALSAVLAFVAIAIAAAPASAAATSSPVAFALSAAGTTGAITLHGTPGRRLRSAVTLRNLSRRRVTVILQTADIENASNGNADYVTTRLHRAGRWLHLASRRVRLAPHAVRQIGISVRVPARAAGGSHYAGIVAINAADLAKHAARGKSKGRAFTFYRISRQALPLTIHLPGRLTRSLTLRSAKLIAEPIGVGLVLGLLPGGTELTQAAPIKLRVLRGARRIFAYHSALGQLFPGSALNYRVPWPGRPTPGTYHLIGQIRPQGSAVINIDRTIRFSAAGARQLTRETPPLARATYAGIPGWIWTVLVGGSVLVVGLIFAVYKLARRPRRTLA